MSPCESTEKSRLNENDTCSEDCHSRILLAAIQYPSPVYYKPVIDMSKKLLIDLLK